MPYKTYPLAAHEKLATIPAMMSKQKIILGATTALVVVSAAAYGLVRYFQAKSTRETPTPSVSVAASATPSVQATPGLGAQLYNQAQNPIQNKLPAANPAVNPLQGVYKNPFQ